VGDYGLRRAAFSVRGGTSDKAIAGYADAVRFERDGFIENLTTGQRVDDVGQLFFRGGVRWVASDQATFTLRLLRGRSRDGAQPLVPLGGPFDSVARIADGVTHVDSLGVSLKGEVTLRAGTLTSVTGVTDWQLDPYTNLLDLGIHLASEIHQRQRAWSQSLGWRASPVDGLEWHLGAFAGRTDTDGRINRGIAGLFLIEASDFVLEADTIALFGEISRRWSDRVTLLGGLRVERTRKKFVRSESVPATTRYDDAQRFDSLQPRLQIDYSFGPRARGKAGRVVFVHGKSRAGPL
jgi:outer membrane receptor protein involved in Fe transport